MYKPSVACLPMAVPTLLGPGQSVCFRMTIHSLRLLGAGCLLGCCVVFGSSVGCLLLLLCCFFLPLDEPKCSAMGFVAPLLWPIGSRLGTRCAAARLLISGPFGHLLVIPKLCYDTAGVGEIFSWSGWATQGCQSKTSETQWWTCGKLTSSWKR